MQSFTIHQELIDLFCLPHMASGVWNGSSSGKCSIFFYPSLIKSPSQQKCCKLESAWKSAQSQDAQPNKEKRFVEFAVLCPFLTWKAFNASSSLLPRNFHRIVAEARDDSDGAYKSVTSESATVKWNAILLPSYFRWVNGHHSRGSAFEAFSTRSWIPLTRRPKNT